MDVSASCKGTTDYMLLPLNFGIVCTLLFLKGFEMEIIDLNNLVLNPKKIPNIATIVM